MKPIAQALMANLQMGATHWLHVTWNIERKGVKVIG
jgi:hypothetical protein